MSKLEAYILTQYGRWVDFDICTRELGFDVEEAVNLTVEKSGSIMMAPTDIWFQKQKKRKYIYSVPVMPTTSVRGDTLLFAELAHLLNLNMHL